MLILPNEINVNEMAALKYQEMAEGLGIDIAL